MLIRKPNGGAFYSDQLLEHVPDTLRWHTHEEISYEFTPGVHRNDTYATPRYRQGSYWYGAARAYMAYTGVVLPAEGTWVTAIHGDLTLENIIWKLDVPIFIDPGRPVLLWRELDEAKLLQSIVTQWEVWRRGWPVCTIPIPIPWETELHHALLLTHWIRLERHYPSAYATFVIDLLRSGRGFNRLRACCIEWLSSALPELSRYGGSRAMGCEQVPDSPDV